MEDKTITRRLCSDCGKEFTMTVEEIKWYENKGFTIPKRCSECRWKRKVERVNNSCKHQNIM